MDSMAAFLIAIIILTTAPGADTVIVIRNSLRGGLPDGFVTVLAICSGLFVHATVSAIGISLIILQSAWLFTLLKFAGAAYLIWLGYSTVTARQVDTSEIDAATGQLALMFNPLRSIREGFLSNVLNPKPMVFYLAFLPQFIDPLQSALSQSLTLALIHFVISVVWLGIVVLLASRMRDWLKGEAVSLWVNRVLGFGLGGFGVALAFQTYRD